MPLYVSSQRFFHGLQLPQKPQPCLYQRAKICLRPYRSHKGHCRSRNPQIVPAVKLRFQKHEYAIAEIPFKVTGFFFSLFIPDIVHPPISCYCYPFQLQKLCSAAYTGFVSFLGSLY